MSHTLFVFNDHDVGRQALERLVSAGIRREALRLHTHEGRPNEKALHDVDEVVTGGVLSSLYGLFEGVFDWGTGRQEAQAYVEILQRGGAVLAVDATEGEEQARVDSAMGGAGAVDRTVWGTGHGPDGEVPSLSNEELIRNAAYARYLARGGRDGDAKADWFEAEREVDAKP
jgi:hypothetical protein